MERILIINGVFIDIDDKTVIGIDSKSYDITNPAQRLNSTSNSFSVPLSENVAKILGFAHNLFSNSINQYQQFTIDYIIGGISIINQGKAYYNGCEYDKSGLVRFNFIVTSKLNIWDELKDISYAQFIDEFLAWASLPPAGSFSSIISLLASPDYDIRLVNYIGILGDELDEAGTAYIESDSTYYIGYNQDSVIYSGGHFGVTCKTIFRFIEHKFGINFNTGGTFQYNLFSDPYASALMIPVREISLNAETLQVDGFFTSSHRIDNVLFEVSGNINKITVTTDFPCKLYIERSDSTYILEHIFQSGTSFISVDFNVSDNEVLNVYSYNPEDTPPPFVGRADFYFSYSSSAIFSIKKNTNISTKENVANFENVTLFDIASSFMTIFNTIKDESYEDRNSIKLYRFDSIENLNASFYEGSFASVSKSDPFFDGIKQVNKIRYSSVFETGDEMTAGKTITSENKSLDKIGDYITIKGYVPAYRSGTIILSYGTDGGALKEPCFFIPTTNKQTKTIKHYSEGVYLSTSVDLNDCAVYSLNSEYSLLSQVVNRPCVVTAKFYINPWQYIKNRLFARYLIPELGGEYIQLSISGYNPTKTSEPVECTFIKIPN